MPRAVRTLRTMRLWDAHTGQCLYVIQDFNGVVESVAWQETAEGSYLVTGSHDKSVRQWEIKKDKDGYKALLHWSSGHEELAVADTLIEGVQGLSEVNHKLLEQRGAVGEPLSLSETNKKTGSLPSLEPNSKPSPDRETLDPSAALVEPILSTGEPTRSLPSINERLLASHLA